ncbi:sulfatase-like hydrolase/transferase [Microbacterium sp.]|uniref:sulfatase-like hydrolase/transferase n=1 Tax=Microbacterium sp. TaxID=51671 RepID=UPI0009289C77|nr:sulfatase-like hydrolase/transferase [Microbacterium sp.]MBN9189683.1 sulfatase-like hydrolase/transferase [Microbacterium sp.]MBN9193901.1 sulfatase-like hydrolase/transferase [Microbacterium sp.]OJU70121.1 MAG: sulfatase [Microbacterium sp. 70-38]
MKAVIVLFDSLNRKYLPPYGADGVHAPHFERLARRSVVFDNCYAGSMPCMPARRELHTGRYNFLHRSWGPLEPFDDSVPEMLGRNDVYCHLATDHHHYWEDGGASYVNRFASYELVRGQAGDPWKGHVGDIEVPDNLNGGGSHTRQDWINRSYMSDEADHSQTRTFDAGLQFLHVNHDADRWMLQIECFDPHEPFFTYDDYRALNGEPAQSGPIFDWPSYRRVIESRSEADAARQNYTALLSMCDRSLGRVLDAFDEYGMWDDTMLIVCTDHGFLLGEQGWWGKLVQPWYDENIHTPLFVWDPRMGLAGTRSTELVQTIDIGPTLLDVFGVDRTADMQGRPLRQAMSGSGSIREGALFGSFGGHVNVTDGRYVYMRDCASPDNTPLFEFTLMPTHMDSRFTPRELAEAELAPPFAFTKGVPTLKVPGWAVRSPYPYGSLLFDLKRDPQQKAPLRDDERELEMAQLLVDLMRETDAPEEQFARLGLPAVGPVTRAHLLIGAQWDLIEAGRAGIVTKDDLAPDAIVATTSLRNLLEIPDARDQLIALIPQLGNANFVARSRVSTVLQAAAAVPGITTEDVVGLERRLQELSFIG